MGAPKVEAYRIVGIPVLIDRTGVPSNDQVQEFLDELGAILEDIQDDFRLLIEKDAIHILTAKPPVAKSVRIAIEPLLDQLSGPVSLVASNHMDWQALKEAIAGMGHSAEELPPGLSRNDLKLKDKPSASKTRRDLEEKLASLVRRHLNGESNKALAICLWGPPGSGKTTLAFECCYDPPNPGVSRPRLLRAA